MRIGVFPAYAIRAYKQCFELAKKGHYLLGMSDRTTDLNTAYTEFLLYCVTPSLSRIMEGILGKIDLIVHHHEPAWMALLAKAAGHKVVVDVGDLDMIRTGQPNPIEVELLEKADGLVYNCVAYEQYIHGSTMKIKTTENQTVLYPFANKDLYCEPTIDTGGIIYQGTIMPPSKLPHPYYYRNMDPLFTAMTEYRIPVHVYPSPHAKNNARWYVETYNSITARAFLALGKGAENLHDGQNVFIYAPLSYGNLIKASGKYHWGFIGTPFEKTYLDLCIPHKLFDYMAAGIPVICMNMSAAASFVEKEGVGIVVKSFKEIKDRYDEWEQYQKNVMAVRDKWAMENHIGDVIKVYENAMNGGK